MEQLHDALVGNIKQIVGEAVKEAILDHCKEDKSKYFTNKV